MKIKISIIISAYNEEKSILNLSKSLLSVLSKLNDYHFEVIFVNDGSTDQTSIRINEFAQNYKAPNVSYVKIEFSKNFGHEAAMISGIDNATGDATICMDADGQHPPEEIPDMITAFLEGNDFVLMSRIQRNGNGFLKKVLSELFYKIINSLSNIPFQENASDFFLISDPIASILRENYRAKNRFIRGFIQSLGFKNRTICFISPDREHGKSNYSYKKLFKLVVSAIFTFSFKPLRLSVFFAIVFILLTIILGIFSLYQYIYGDTPPSGYTTIILFISLSFTLLFSIISIQLLYFEKLIEEIRQSPIYIIKSKHIYGKTDK